VVDPGHGGEDRGAVGPGGTSEYEVNLAISRELAGFLQKGGARVILTRDNGGVEDRGLGGPSDLEERVELARREGAGLFISIHCNAFDDREKGAQVFYNPKSSRAQRLAQAVQNSIKKRLGNTERELLPLEAYVLQEDLLSIIVEVGFISNPREEKLLADKDYQRKMAYAIFAGVVDYLAAEAASKGGG